MYVIMNQIYVAGLIAFSPQKKVGIYSNLKKINILTDNIHDNMTSPHARLPRHNLRNILFSSCTRQNLINDLLNGQSFED